MCAAKLDPRLRYLQEETVAERVESARSLRMASVTTSRRTTTVEVTLRCRKQRGVKTLRTIENKLKEYGLEVRAAIDGAEAIVAGAIDLDQLSALLEEPWVEQIDASHGLFLDLDRSGPETHVRPLQTVPPTVRGSGVLVGIIDTGIDFKHDDFRLADGSSRIRFLWDQTAPQVAGGTVPFGRQYTQADLDAALRTSPAPVPVPQADSDGHGTHVAGIAAGNGRASNGQFMGMAPEAELVIVKMRSDGNSLGESNAAVAACAYIVERARQLGRPVAINMSQGMNAGGHSGETTLEKAMDNLCRENGVVIVKSAGNEQQWRIHAGGTVALGATERRRFDSSGDNVDQDVLEVWFDAADQIALAVQAPGAPAPQAADFVAPGDTKSFQTPADNGVRIDASSVDASGTGDVRAIIFIRRGAAPRIQPGRWTLHLRGDAVGAEGTFHVWIERTRRDNGGDEQSRFVAADANDLYTISIPGTARRIITVGSYVTRASSGSAALGELSRFSSHGPTRYDLQKPELAAPGDTIVAALSSMCSRPPVENVYTTIFGTSMAAPHVAGVAALLLEINPQFTCDQVKQLLMHAARREGAAATAPDHGWGHGKLAAQGAVELARQARFPAISDVTVTGSVVSWRTDIATTGAIRFSTHQRRLSLGRAQGSRVVLTAAAQHQLDLTGLPAGRYYCEILAFTPAPDEWRTTDDNGGTHYEVVLP